MGRMAVPPLKFGVWRQWDAARSSTPDTTLPGGLYLLAHCHTRVAPTNATTDDVPWEVVYIGITRNLHHRPARAAHAGVKDYRAKIDGSCEGLFLTTAPLFDPKRKDYPVLRIYAECLESSLVWQYTDQHGHPPALHYDQKGYNKKEVDVLIRALQGGQAARKQLAAIRSRIAPKSAR